MEELIEDVLDRLEPPIKQAMQDAKVEPKDIDKVILVGGPTRMPCVRERFKKLLKKEPEGGVDPMECVAMGAAIQGGVLAGDVSDVVLLDVTPLSLGIETLGGVITTLIQANTTIPTRREEIFSTASDSQRTVDIHVLQGERPMAIDNKTIGRFQLDGIPPAPRGVPQIAVAFDIDANGILSVSATDKATGREQHIKIQASSGLSKEEIDKMKSDAKSHAAEDQKRREEVETRNRADQQVWQTEKQIEELGDKVDAESKAKLQAGADRIKEALKGTDVQAIKDASDDLDKIWQQISTKMYDNIQAQQQATGGGPTEEKVKAESSKDEGEVEDADYEVVE